ncbi:hypothetical protein D3C86_1729550 [compost metagenome]
MVELPLTGSFIIAIPSPIFIDRICPAVCSATNTRCIAMPNSMPHSICSPMSKMVRTDINPVSITFSGNIGVIITASAREIAALMRLLKARLSRTGQKWINARMRVNGRTNAIRGLISVRISMPISR